MIKVSRWNINRQLDVFLLPTNNNPLDPPDNPQVGSS
jgi:hypothetical protein